MGTIQGSSADISHPRRPSSLTQQEMAILVAMYFTGLLNHRVHDLAAKDRDSRQTQATLDMLQQRGLVWKDRLNVYHLTEAGTHKILEVPDSDLETLLGETTVIFGGSESAEDPPRSRPVHARGYGMMLLLFILWFSATWGLASLLDALANALAAPPDDAVRVVLFIVSALVNIFLMAVLIVAASSGGQGGSDSGETPP